MSIAAKGIGSQSLSSAAVELLADPKKLAATRASLEEAQRQAQAKIDLAGPAEEIIVIRAQVAAELEQQRKLTEEAESAAEQKLIETQDKANDMLAVAEEEAESIVAAAEEVKLAADEMNRTADAKYALAEQKMAGVRVTSEKREQELSERENNILAREDELDNQASENERINSSLLKEKARLAEMREHLTSMLE